MRTGYAPRGVRIYSPHGLSASAHSSEKSQAKSKSKAKSTARSKSKSNSETNVNIKSLLRGLHPLILRASPCAPQPATTTLAPAAPPPPGAIGVVLAVARVGLRISFHSLRSLQRLLRRLGASRRASRLGNPFFHALHLWKAHPPLRVGCGLATLNLLNFASQSFEPQTRFARLPFCFGRKLKKGVAQALRSGRRGFCFTSPVMVERTAFAVTPTILPASPLTANSGELPDLANFDLPELVDLMKSTYS